MFMMFLMCIFHIEILDYSILYGIHVKIPFESAGNFYIMAGKGSSWEYIVFTKVFPDSFEVIYRLNHIIPDNIASSWPRYDK